jgi:hypothetical protein
VSDTECWHKGRPVWAPRRAESGRAGGVGYERSGLREQHAKARRGLGLRPTAPSSQVVGQIGEDATVASVTG